ncbi:MAG: class I SAM-dependent methyltransferase [Deltaproteobacteria bacterium]|nr:class I SAM-dependent methyltransferase [Deltaproteobacteria bacterium]
MQAVSGQYITSCPVGCGNDFKDTDIILPEGPLRRCVICGQLVSQCSELRFHDSMKEFQDPRGTVPIDKSGARRLDRRTRKIISGAEKILGLIPQEMCLLDVGCSSGAFLSAARRMGLKAEGVEPEPGPAKTAAESGLKVTRGFLEDANFPGESFHIITLFEVLEHLKDSLSLMRECNRVLRPGGIAIIRTGNSASWTSAYMKGRWEYFHIAKHGGHVSFFNPFSIRHLAERSGFRIEKMTSYAVRFYEKGDVSYPIYRITKIFSELLNTPSSLFNKGHELLVYMKKR